MMSCSSGVQFKTKQGGRLKPVAGGLMIRFFKSDNLISQFVTLNRGGRRKLPNAITEHGVAVLNLPFSTTSRVTYKLLHRQ
jgi:hypothetical protein